MLQCYAYNRVLTDNGFFCVTVVLLFVLTRVLIISTQSENECSYNKIHTL